MGRLRRGAVWLLFALVLLIPKFLGLRRRAALWNTLRGAAAAAAMAFVANGVAGDGSPRAAVAGGLLLLLALVARPERRRPSVDERARELGASVVVNGGRYRLPSGATRETNLFVGRERIWVVDAALRVMEEIPLAQVSSLRAEPAGRSWRLSVAGAGTAAVFEYEGVFAEHLARVAESALRAQLRRELPVLPGRERRS